MTRPLIWICGRTGDVFLWRYDADSPRSCALCVQHIASFAMRGLLTWPEATILSQRVGPQGYLVIGGSRAGKRYRKGSEIGCVHLFRVGPIIGRDTLYDVYQFTGAAWVWKRRVTSREFAEEIQGRAGT